MSAGSDESVFELDGVTAASVICYDIRFPEWVRTQMAQGAKVLFVVAQWPWKFYGTESTDIDSNRKDDILVEMNL